MNFSEKLPVAALGVCALVVAWLEYFWISIIDIAWMWMLIIHQICKIDEVNQNEDDD